MAVRSVIFDLVGRDRVTPAFLSAAASSEKAATRMSGSLAKMQRVSASMTKAITVPVLALSGIAIKQASDFQKAQTLLQTAGGETADKMAAISAGIKQTALDTGASLSQLNTGMYTIAKFGAKLPVVDQLRILRAAAEGAAAENADLGTAVGALTTVMQSYNVPASKAISIQNELVAAAGKSKTTFSEFAGSLSSVVPLASSLHVSFAQIAGAIATMTQHGETAQQSTENLNNLLTALAGQNQVASNAMQQLGINTLDLQKNLGTRGLTGTLAIVDAALKAHTKNGMIVTSVYKANALANQSLQQALGGMTDGLLKNSKALLSGKMGISEYQKYAKSLGGEAGAAGLQFLTLYKSAEGFSNQLKSGQSTISTSTTQMQKMLGGLTGMGVALKLGGGSARTFSEDVDAIGKAASKNGKDIETWAQTQQTAAVKGARLRAQLQVLSVDIGTQLLPIVLKIAKVFSGIVSWFSHLSKGTQGWIIKIALLAAALGPVIGLVTRLWKAVMLLGGTLAVMGRFAKGFLLIETSAKAAGTASWAAGLKMRAAFTSSTEVGAASSAWKSLAGSVGFGVVAVVGITAAFVAAGAAISHFIDKNSAEVFAMKGLAKATGEYGAALKAANGHVDSNVRSSTALQLEQDGLAGKAHKAGISLTELTKGLLGSKTQFAALISQWKAGGSPSGDTIAKLKMMYATFGLVNTATADTIAQQKAAAKVAADLAKKTAIAANAVSVLSATFDQANHNLSAGSAMKDFTNSLHTMRYETASTSDAFKGLFQRAIDVASAQQAAGKSNQDVAQTLINNIGIVETMAAKYGLTQSAVAALIKTMGLTPSQIDTYFNIDTAEAMSKIVALRAALSTIDPGQGGSAGVTAAKIAAQMNAINAQLAAAAKTGHVTGGSKISTPKIGAGTGTGGGSAASKPSFDTSTLSGFIQTATNAQSNPLTSALASILASAKAAGKKFSAAFLKGIGTENNKLKALVSQRDKIASQLDAANQKLADAKSAYTDYRSTVASSVSGTFDVSSVQSLYSDQATGIGSILSALSRAVANAGKFSTTIKALVKRGLAKPLIQQLLAAGPAALPQALALLSASAADFSTVNTGYAKLTASANDLGKFSADTFYSAGIKTAQGLVDGLKASTSKVEAAIAALAAKMVAQLKKSLGIHSPSKVMHQLGVFTGQGYANGISSMVPKAQYATKQLVNPPSPSKMSGEGSGEYHHHDHWHITPQDTSGLINAVQRRQQMRARA